MSGAFPGVDNDFSHSVGASVHPMTTLSTVGRQVVRRKNIFSSLLL